MTLSDEVNIEGLVEAKQVSQELLVVWYLRKIRDYQRGEFHISHDASRQICLFSPRWKERSRVSREIFNGLNFKMQLIQGKF